MSPFLPGTDPAGFYEGTGVVSGDRMIIRIVAAEKSKGSGLVDRTKET